MLLMALLAISQRDRSLIIWNFMEELSRKHMSALSSNISTYFLLSEFRYLDVFYRYFPSVGIPESITADVILSIIEEYLERKGYYNIDRGVVNLTALGLSECQKSFRDWDQVNWNLQIYFSILATAGGERRPEITFTSCETLYWA